MRVGLQDLAALNLNWKPRRGDCLSRNEPVGQIVIIVDTSVWIDHLRANDRQLATQLEQMNVLVHPFVTGEIALGNLRNRKSLIELLQSMPQAVIASEQEIMLFIEDHRLFGLGIGFIEAHFLASTLLTSGSRLWTRDKRLQNAAHQLGLNSNL